MNIVSQIPKGSAIHLRLLNCEAQVIETPFLDINGEAISLELALGVALMDDGYDIREQLASKYALRSWALDQNVVPTNEDFQAELNAFRQEMDLGRRTDFEKWMSSNSVSEATIRLVCEFRALTNALLASVPDAEIAAAYQEIEHSLSEVSLYLLSLETQTEAQSLAEALRAKKIGFLEAVDQYCDAETKATGDFASTFALADLPKQQRDILRSLDVGDVAGPIEEEGRWLLIKLTAMTTPSFDDVADDLRADIAAEVLGRYIDTTVVLRDIG